jgi:hypothetical protein
MRQLPRGARNARVAWCVVGRRRLIPVGELQRWLDANASLAIQPLLGDVERLTRFAACENVLAEHMPGDPQIRCHEATVI